MTVRKSSHLERSGYEDADFCSSETSGDKHADLLLEAMTLPTKTTLLLQAGWITMWK